MVTPRFLYVENDAMSREVMELLITVTLGYPELTMWDTSDNFEERLAALSNLPDVIFLDIYMEPLNGYAMLDMLRQSSKFHKCKIIAVTSSVMVTDVANLQKAGFDGLIGKPIKKHLFPELLDAILGGQSVWFVP
ncbi:MAG: response regulator [Chloroflexi bacterium]|nr:response regulator [Chloroflexota bacterium]